MSKNRLFAWAKLAFLIVGFIPFYALAGGICLYEISSADTRLASAGWSARAEDPSTVFTNPAGMTRLCGKQIEFGVQPIFAHVKFDPNSETTFRGSEGHANKWLPSGSLFYVHPYSDRLTFGVGTLGYFGADLAYNHGWVGRYYVQKVILQGFSFIPAVAYKVNDQWSVGIGAHVMYGILKQRSAVNNLFDHLPDGYLRVQDSRFGFGGILGILYEPSCNTRFGLQYLSEVKLSFRDKPKFEQIGPALEDLLRVSGILGSSFDLHVRVPQSVIVSAYHRFCPCWAVMANVGWQQWSRFEQVSVVLADLNRDHFTFKHKYRDCWHLAFGAEANWSNCLVLSGGVAYDSSVVGVRQRTPNFPVGAQWRLGTGARWFYSDHLTFDFCCELQWQGNLKLNVNKGPIAGRVVGMFKDTYAVFTNFNATYVF